MGRADFFVRRKKRKKGKRETAQSTVHIRPVILLSLLSSG